MARTIRPTLFRRREPVQRRRQRPPAWSTAERSQFVSSNFSTFRNHYQLAHSGHQPALLGRGERGHLPSLGALGSWQRAGEKAVAGLGAPDPLHAPVVRVSLAAQPAAVLQIVKHGYQRAGVKSTYVG